MWTRASNIQKAVVMIVIAVLLIVMADTGYGLYVYSASRQECTNHMMYNIPGRGRLTDNPYSTEEIGLIRLDCQAYGLESQLENVRLPFNQSRVDNQLARAQSECALEPSYDFSWGCDE